VRLQKNGASVCTMREEGTGRKVPGERRALRRGTLPESDVELMSSIKRKLLEK